MKIENSPFHITRNKISNVNSSSQTNNNTKEIINNEDKKTENSFWDWFRGLVNPLQNLPILSGIYSSMNSDDSKSDRDLVQNSLGGFMYGGPIGAIAGFGNWVFNKLFDKTPTELALDFTGISNLWKDDDQSKNKKILASNDLDKKSVNSNGSSVNTVGEWWKKNKNIDRAVTAVSQNSMPDNKQANNTSINNQKSILDKYSLDQNSKKININQNEIIKYNKSQNISNEFSAVNFEQEEPKKKNIGKINRFREINFDYPVWKPEDHTISKSKLDKSSRDLINQKYLEIKNGSQGSKLNMKL